MQTIPGDDAEIALLMKEGAFKKTRHLPIRQLVRQRAIAAAPAQAVHAHEPTLGQPILASRKGAIRPGGLRRGVANSAGGALLSAPIYRSKQLVITGDNQQLPPTTFFQQNTDDGDDEDDAPLYESILDTCLGAGMPRRMLSWHYRSQHEHLIAFSNETYYEGRLFTFPSASFQHPGLGVQLRHVPDGVYDRGEKRDNPREAQVVAQRVLDHFRQSPNKTIGVIAFSYAQMDAIEDEIERCLQEQTDLERFSQKRSTRRLLRQEPGDGTGGRARRDSAERRLRPGRHGEDRAQLRPAQS